MLTFTRTIKDGTTVQFKFIQKCNRYELDYDGIDFWFSKYEKFIVFNINTNKMAGLGYGATLISIAIEFAKDNNLDFVSGHLSFADRDNGNWKYSVPFYLKQRDNAFIIKTDTGVFMRALYPQYKNTTEFFNDFKHYTSYSEFVTENSEGYIIYLLVRNQS